VNFLSKLTKTCVLVNRHKEIVFEENVADDAEHVHEDQSKNGCEYDGTAIAGNRSNHIEQSLLAINDIEKLEKKKKKLLNKNELITSLDTLVHATTRTRE
jgi:hypothetical protein